MSSLPLLDHRFSVLVCLALPRAELVLLRLALRPCGRTPTGAVGRGRSRAAPPPGSRGPASPASLPPLAPLAPAMGLAGFGRAVAAYGGLFLRLPPTFHNVGFRYCSESATPALRGAGSGALNPAVPCFLRGAHRVGRSASTPPAMERPKRREGFRCASSRSVSPCGLLPLLLRLRSPLTAFPPPPAGLSCVHGLQRPCGLNRVLLRLRSPLTAFPPPPAGLSCVLSVLRPCGRSPLPTFWLVGYRSARHFCSWVSNGNGARRSRPPHDPIFIEPTLRTLNDEKR